MRCEVLKQANESESINTIKQHNNFLDEVRKFEQELIHKKAETSKGLYQS